MAPRPQDMSMNQELREDSVRSGMSESEYLAAAAAAKPKDESLYESLLRYQEEQDPGDSMSSIPKLSYDEDDDRKLPAKPTPIRHRSRTDTHINAMRKNQDDESLTWEQHDSFAEPSLYPKLSASTSRDKRFEPSPSPGKWRPEQRHPGSLLSESLTSAGAASNTNSAPRRQSSFYKSALEASKKERHSPLFAIDLVEDEKLARELARELDEKLAAQKEAKKIEAEDAKLARELHETLAQEAARDCVAGDADPGQLEILRAIREDRERKELEKALQGSGSTGLDFYTAPDPPGTTFPPPEVDYLLSQQLALQEWQGDPRAPIARSRSPVPPVRQHQSHVQPIHRRSQSTGNPHGPHRISFEHYTPHSSDEAEHHPNAEEDRLLQQGNMETREAIAEGRAHVVQCMGCLGRLHAPMSYALVFCPKCHHVSPGQTYVPRDDRGSTRRGRSRHA
jgi:hypothetical protein